ncbi:hypothetical protein G7Y89_g14445 [Cudoniella acicularis]|uniref:Hydrophobin n=1 Tax=Cudoniella acicularis TaxID=354080 RepID=A0A8H4VVJ9_9HELO|nr:hypothetical protein G7Y89_g14445 [Cudoniella acicularis]
MHFQRTSFIVVLSIYFAIGLGVPVDEPVAKPVPEPIVKRNADPVDPLAHFTPFHNLLAPRGNARAHDPNCPNTQPVDQNLCTSGSPYCCSGSGNGAVCGPSSSTQCSSTTICCINTNGMQICAGEIDFTGPVTININV